MSDVLEVVPNLSPSFILREMALSDGYLFQAEAWLKRGLDLRRSGDFGSVSASKYFRGKLRKS